MENLHNVCVFFPGLVGAPRRQHSALPRRRPAPWQPGRCQLTARQPSEDRNTMFGDEDSDGTERSHCLYKLYRLLELSAPPTLTRDVSWLRACCHQLLELLAHTAPSSLEPASLPPETPGTRRCYRTYDLGFGPPTRSEAAAIRALLFHCAGRLATKVVS